MSSLHLQQLLVVLLVVCSIHCSAFQNLFPNFPSFAATPKTATKKTTGVVELEERLLAALANQDARLSNSDEVAQLVEQLEASGASIERPAIAPEVYGKWRLMQTTNADSASPIQRKAVDTSKFAIYQDIEVNSEGNLIVSQVVKFSDKNALRVDAIGSTSAYPIDELTDREGTGKILGLNILGVSLVGDEAEEDPTRPDSRIRFVFDEGNFDLGAIGLKIPYPVPFRWPLFRDAVKGWIDITYLSERIRIARGNKGTTFVLVKED